MNHDEPNLSRDDGVDRAIRAALQVDVEDERLARLEQFWLTSSQQQRWRGRLQRITAIAATLAAIAALGVAWNRRIAPPRVVDGSSPARSILADNVNASTVSPSSVGRVPTAYERLVFTARTGVRQSAEPVAAKIDSIIQQLSLDANADAREAIVSLDLQRDNLETPLLRRLPRAAVAEQAAILRLLAVCGTQRSVPSLLRLARQVGLQDEAIAALEQIVGVEGLPQLLRASNDRNLRATILRRLLAADPEAGLLNYLSLVHDEATRSESLAVAGAAPSLPMDELFALLDDSKQSVRLSAALVLGHVDGPAVTRRLIARVTRQPAKSREAWMALLTCRGELADEFFAYAMRRPQLLGYVNNARVQWSQMIP
jgi:hypothetical protein